MLIRSQNKASIVNFDNVFNIAAIRNINGAVAIYIRSSSSCCNMAEYSTKAKAMKVLDMIQEAYADEKLVDYTKYLQRKEIEKMDDSTILAIRNELMKKAVFQMPDDSEVEV